MHGLENHHLSPFKHVTPPKHTAAFLHMHWHSPMCPALPLYTPICQATKEEITTPRCLQGKISKTIHPILMAQCFKMGLHCHIMQWCHRSISSWCYHCISVRCWAAMPLHFCMALGCTFAQHWAAFLHGTTMALLCSITMALLCSIAMALLCSIAVALLCSIAAALLCSITTALLCSIATAFAQHHRCCMTVQRHFCKSLHGTAAA